MKREKQTTSLNKLIIKVKEGERMAMAVFIYPI